MPSSNHQEMMESSYNHHPRASPAAASTVTQSPPLFLNEMNSRTSSKTDNQFWMDAAATVTQQSCPLLGVKSLGVDYGRVRTGVASTVGYTPQALCILPTQYNETSNTQPSLVEALVKLCRTEQASRIVVGLPLHKNGTHANQTILTLEFATELAAGVLTELGPSVPVQMWDERYTSKYAAARAHNNKDEYDHRSMVGTLDADAACIILEHYYEKSGEHAKAVTLPPELHEQCLEAYHQRHAQDQLQQEQALAQRLEQGVDKRKQAMERARLLEAELASQGLLGTSRKKKKSQKKKSREKRGDWRTPSTSSGSDENSS